MRQLKQKKRSFPVILSWVCIFVCVILVPVCGILVGQGNADAQPPALFSDVASYSMSLDAIPAFSDEPFILINENRPSADLTSEPAISYERYSKLDELGRCGVALACVGKDIMPTEERGSIGTMKPSGWHTVKYANVDGKYLYNRCHLIAYQLSGENANEKNLITGTRYLNMKGMLPLENMVAEYVQTTGNHVMYRATPHFAGNELVARGVELEAYSLEDAGEGISFHVFCYNAQPGIVIDYATGDSRMADDASGSAEGSTVSDTVTSAPSEKSAETADVPEQEVPTTDEPNVPTIEVTETEVTDTDQAETCDYVLNTDTKKFHKPSCSHADRIKAENRQNYSGTRDGLIADGYEPCKVCKP